MTGQSNKSGDKHFETAKEILKGALFLLIFAAFPIIVMQFARHKIDELEIAQNINHQRLTHERILGKMRQADENAEVTGRSIKLIFEKLRLATAPEIRIQYVQSLHRSYPQAIDLYIFNGKGRLIPEISSKRMPRRGIEFALEAIIGFARDEDVPAGKLGILKNIVGLQELPPLLKGQVTANKLGNRKLDSHFAWFHSPATESVSIDLPHSYLALIHEEKIDPDHALKNTIKWVNNRYPHLKAGFLDIEKKERDVYPSQLGVLEDLRLNFIKSEAEYENFFRSRQYFCTFIKKSVSKFIFISQKNPVFFSHGSNLALNFLCLAWLIFVFRNLPVANRQIQGGITAKLVFLFLFSIGSPSFLLMIGGYYALKDHGNVRQQELEKKMVSKLNHFDEKYPLDLKSIGDFLRQIIVKAQQHETLDQIIEELKITRSRKDIFMQGYLLNEKGQELFSLHEQQTSVQVKNKKIVILVARELLSRLNKSMKVDSGTLMMEATEDFFTSVIDSNFDFNVLIKSMGEFIPMTFGTEGSYLFSEAILNKDGEARYAVIFVANRPVVARKYIRRNISSLANQSEFSWKVNAYGVNRLAGHELTTPKLRAKIMQLSETMMARNAPVREIQASGTEEILWYAQRGANLFDYALVAMTSLQPLKDEINLKWFYLILLAATLFIIAALIGFTLSTQFLIPIENLTNGVKAIDRRQFDVKVPVLSHDELGQLSSLLNSVLEGMKDLEVASIVQTSLFPSEKLIEKEIEIYGKSCAMTDIGGDYFDYFVADGNRIIGLVGDVSGHGVSAALIMGMAKFAFTTKESANRPLPETLASFNLFLISNIQRKKMMTMFLYCINTETYEMEYSNAGHNPPFQLNAAGDKVAQIEMESFPLGIRAKSKYRSERVKIEPGDKILMYTDGLVEATVSDQKMIGYEKAREWFSQAVGLNAEESVTMMFQRFNSATEGRAAEDDISLIVIHRHA